MSHGTDVIEGRSADVTHLAIHGKVTVKSNSKNFDLILMSTALVGVGDFDCCDVRVTLARCRVRRRIESVFAARCDAYAVMRCLCVRVSVTFVSCVKTNTDIFHIIFTVG